MKPGRNCRHGRAMHRAIKKYRERLELAQLISAFRNHPNPFKLVSKAIEDFARALNGVKFPLIH